MAQVYVVTSGEYSDYHIEAIFSTPEKAYGYLATREWGARIEEYELDVTEATDVPEHLTAYVVTMDDNGDGGQVTRPEIEEEWTPNRIRTYHEPTNRDKRLRRNRMELNIAARDEQHAIKIANERRILLIGIGQWATQSDRPLHS